MTIRVVLAEDHVVVADALATMLGFEPDIEVVGVAGSGTEAVRLALDARPDVVVMDVGLDGLNGIEATREINRDHRDIGVLMLSMHDDADTITAALVAGARGFLPKNVDRTTLVAGIRAVTRGDGYLDPTAARSFLDRVRPLAADALAANRLTAREHDVLGHLAAGMSTKQIAGALVISEDTVKTHLRHVYEKLGVADRVQAVAVALRTGLIA
jgi:DNA-binding NarL/FixJ family response regulator